MEENECLKEVAGKKNVYEPIPAWAKKINEVCTSMGDCGANVNINDVYTDNGYLWKYNNDSFSLLGNINRGLNSLASGNVIAENSNEYLINEKIKIGGDKYVLVKK